MLKLFGPVVVAATIVATASVPSTTAEARSGGTNTAATSPSAVTAQVQRAAPGIRRVRKPVAQPMRRIAVVAAPTSHHSQCILFWCSGVNRPFHWLVLGVGY